MDQPDPTICLHQFYEDKNSGEMKPGKKGISLTPEVVSVSNPKTVIFLRAILEPRRRLYCRRHFQQSEDTFTADYSFLLWRNRFSPLLLTSHSSQKWKTLKALTSDVSYITGLCLILQACSG